MLGWMTFWERMIGLVGFENLLTELALGSPALVEIRFSRPTASAAYRDTGSPSR
jgi:hypothetical protein